MIKKANKQTKTGWKKEKKKKENLRGNGLETQPELQ